MKTLLSCEFNMDTACVELKFTDGSLIAIDTIAVENEIADNMYQRSELDYTATVFTSPQTGKAAPRTEHFPLLRGG